MADRQAKDALFDPFAEVAKARASGRQDVAAEHVAGFESLTGAYLGNRQALEAISRKELTARLRRGDLVVVAYCRGRYCVYDDAVRELNRRGYVALRLEDGFPEWKQAGLPVAVGQG